MCGIVGIFDTRGKREINRDLLVRLNETQNHRGPDECAVHLEPGVGFGHKRLSIIDLSTGQQPLWNEDHTVVVVFNGEIYNYQVLIPELVALGHVFRTRSDTDVPKVFLRIATPVRPDATSAVMALPDRSSIPLAVFASYPVTTTSLR